MTDIKVVECDYGNGKNNKTKNKNKNSCFQNVVKLTSDDSVMLPTSQSLREIPETIVKEKQKEKEVETNGKKENKEEEEEEEETVSVPEFSRHMVYILCNDTNNACYVGYTVNFTRRLRQHNTELVGGARFTSRLVKTKNIRWKPLALIRIPTQGFDQRRGLSLEWSCKYPDNRRSRPSKFNSQNGRLVGLGLVFDNPKFGDLSFHVQVFTKGHFDVLSSVLTATSKDRITIQLEDKEKKWVF